MVTDQSKQGENICGRCNIPEGDRVSLNSAFEAMAKYLEFPCINSKTCSRLLRWGEVEEHEEVCGLETVQCDICLDLHPVTKIVPHFEKLHRKNIFYDSILVATQEEIGKPISTNQFLMVISNEPYLISTEVAYTSAKLQNKRIILTSNVKLTIKVTPLLESFKFRTFTIMISNENHTIVYRNNPIKRKDNVDNWVSHMFDLTTLKRLFNPDKSALKIELKIDPVTKKTERPKDLEETTMLFEKLVKDLECPICTTIMDSDIIVCRRGHSICEKCKNSSVTECPICRGPFVADRNFALEDVCKKLKDFEL